jgi:hypothetical protein
VGKKEMAMMVESVGEQFDFRPCHASEVRTIEIIKKLSKVTNLEAVDDKPTLC